MAPYLAMCREDTQQRKYRRREVSKGLRYVVRTGVQRRMVPMICPVDGHLSARAAVDSSPVFPGHDRGFAHVAAGVRRAQSASDRRRSRGHAPAMTEPNGVRDRRFMRHWIPWAICWSCMLRRQMSKIVNRWRSWPNWSRRLPVNMWNWRTSIRVTPERPRSKRPPPMALSWPWSNIRRPKAASSSCPAVG